ncbi:MAG: DUF1924 domain-containing protein [Magnetococcus sp. DMHC-6]
MKMKTSLCTATLTAILLASSSLVWSADKSAGEALWHQSFGKTEAGEIKSCTTCHSQDLKQVGRHITTGKPIEPMAVSVNPQRYTDPEKIEKWFKRNCKWTLDRECTQTEKENILAYLKSL